MNIDCFSLQLVKQLISGNETNKINIVKENCVGNKRHTRKTGLWMHDVDTWALEAWMLRVWTLGVWTLEAWTTGRFDSRRLDSGRFDSGPLDPENSFHF